MTRRVVVTGMGGLCATGNNVKEFWNNLQSGVCGIVTRTIEPAEGYSITAPIAPIDGFDERVAGLGKEMGRAD
ncbi:MAG: beta-ketoacyl synthase N-terminal-like domain-containing protein, partial [Parvularculaceae bacterium]